MGCQHILLRPDFEMLHFVLKQGRSKHFLFLVSLLEIDADKPSPFLFFVSMHNVDQTQKSNKFSCFTFCLQFLLDNNCLDAQILCLHLLQKCSQSPSVCVGIGLFKLQFWKAKNPSHICWSKKQFIFGAPLRSQANGKVNSPQVGTNLQTRTQKQKVLLGPRAQQNNASCPRPGAWVSQVNCCNKQVENKHQWCVQRDLFQMP